MRSAPAASRALDSAPRHRWRGAGTATRGARRYALLLLATMQVLAGSATAQDGDAVERAARLFDQRRHAEAKALLEPIANTAPGHARAAYFLGRIAMREGNTDHAARWLEKAVRLEPGVSDYHMELAGAYGEKAMRANFARQAILARKAKSHLDRAVELDPENVDARFGLVQFYLVAPSVMGGSKARAEEEAAEVRKRNAYRGVQAFALVHTAEKDFAAAEAEYRAGIREYPDSARLYQALAHLYLQTKQYEQAFDTADRLLQREPGDMVIQFQIGRAAAMSGQRLGQAEEALRRYLQHTPRPGEPPLAAAHWRLGMIYEQQGQTELARAEYQAALRLDPRHKEAKRALRKLDG